MEYLVHPQDGMYRSKLLYKVFDLCMRGRMFFVMWSKTVKRYALLTVKLYVLLIAVCVEPDPALVKWFLSLMADNRTSDVSNG